MPDNPLDFNLADQLSRRREPCGMYPACVPLRFVPPLELQRRDTESTRQESNASAPSPPNLNKRRRANHCSASLSTPRESAYTYKLYSVCPLPSLFATSHPFSVFQGGYFGPAKRCTAHRDTLFARFVAPFTSLFPTSRNTLPVSSVLSVCTFTGRSSHGNLIPDVLCII